MTMDANGAKPQQDRKGVPRTMKEMMGTMCCSGEFSPADMRRQMMRSMERASSAEAQPAPEGGTTSDGSKRTGEDEAPQPCCGPQARCAPKCP